MERRSAVQQGPGLILQSEDQARADSAVESSL